MPLPPSCSSPSRVAPRTGRLLSLATVAALALTACGGNRLHRMEVRTTLTPRAITSAAEIEGVWLDSTGTSLLYVKQVGDEARILLVDGTIRHRDDIEALNREDGGAAARQVANEWPFKKPEGRLAVSGGRVVRPAKQALALVVTGRLDRGFVRGPWAFAAECTDGRPGPARNKFSAFELRKAMDGTLALAAVVTATPGGSEDAAQVAYDDNWLFARVDPRLDKKMAARLEDPANFCRPE